MKYKIRQKIFSFGDNFVIKNEFDEDKYIVQGKIFALGDKLKLLDINGVELINIQQKLFKLLPEYYLFSGGEQLARIKKAFTLLKHRFDIDSSMGQFEMQGNFLAHDFRILKDNKVVATVNKKWLSLADTYMVEISDEEDQAFMLAMIIVIDQVIHDKNHNSR